MALGENVRLLLAESVGRSGFCRPQLMSDRTVQYGIITVVWIDAVTQYTVDAMQKNGDISRSTV